MTKERLDEILLECGFSKLMAEHDFDGFILRYLDSRDPADLLMEEVTRYARRRKIFSFIICIKILKTISRNTGKSWVWTDLSGDICANRKMWYNGCAARSLTSGRYEVRVWISS